MEVVSCLLFHQTKWCTTLRVISHLSQSQIFIVISIQPIGSALDLNSVAQQDLLGKESSEIAAHGYKLRMRCTLTRNDGGRKPREINEQTQAPFIPTIGFGAHTPQHLVTLQVLLSERFFIRVVILKADFQRIQMLNGNDGVLTWREFKIQCLNRLGEGFKRGQ